MFWQCALLNEKEINYLARLKILAHGDSSSLSTFSEEPTPFRHRSVSDTRASVGRHSKYYTVDKLYCITKLNTQFY